MHAAEMASPGAVQWSSARIPLLSLPCAVSHAVWDTCVKQTRLGDASALMHAGGGLPHMLPPRPAHREFEARGLLHSPPGFGAEGVDVRQSRGYAPPAVQHAPLQPPNRSAGLSAAAAARVSCSPFQAAPEPAAPSYTAIPAPAHAISRLVEPDIEAQGSALQRGRLEGQVDRSTDTDMMAASSHEEPTKLPALSDSLQAATSASELWQLDAQHSSFPVMEQVGDLEEDLPGGNQGFPSAAEQSLPVTDSQNDSRHSSGIEYAAEEGSTAAVAAQAAQEPSMQQVSSVWGNPLATVRMPQGAPVRKVIHASFPRQHPTVPACKPPEHLRQPAVTTNGCQYGGRTSLCAAARRMRGPMTYCAGEALARAPHQQAGSGAAAASGARSEADCVPALRVPPGMRLINPAELTLGALIGEGGFGKARGHLLTALKICARRSCLTRLQGPGMRPSSCIQWSTVGRCTTGSGGGWRWP